MSYLIVSPHLDDAVLSCGQLMAAYPGTQVVTVFAGIPENEELSTDYDRQSGWHDAVQAVTGRRAEDARACCVLDAWSFHLDGVDVQYAERVAVEAVHNGDSADHIEVRTMIPDQTLRSFLDESDLPVVFPLGLVHPDHITVQQVVFEWAREQQRDVLVYEELPARVLWPEVVWANIEVMRANGAFLTCERELVAGPMHLKRAAVACYRSQAWALERMSEPACFVPERYWRLTWE